MHPRQFAGQTPDKTALVFEPSGKTLSYGALERAANTVAQLFRAQGIKAGDAVAFCLENGPEVFAFCWGAQRAGLYFVPISSRLTANEITYIVKDSGAKLLLTSDYLASELDQIAAANPGCALFKTGQSQSAFASWDEALSAHPDTPIADESRGLVMFYSSGTTGQPKGIAPAPLTGDPVEIPEVLPALVQHILGADDSSVYLSPAPLYHAAPLGWTMSMNRLGATAIVMEQFDAATALALIDKHAVTCGQFVPTHFVRMLKLPEAERAKHSLKSLKAIVHAAAPCPVPVKQAMIDWLGPIINEYYAGSEGNGMTAITATEWLSHPGSVGHPLLGAVHICDEDGAELPAGEDGLVYFEGGNDFRYHNDPDKTASTRHRNGWSTLGDIGHVDTDGYLYLTDRKSFMIISGGVNIYPQEIENLLVTHPKVLDVAVIGAPDADFGEKVVAVVQPRSMDEAGEALAKELTVFCRTALSAIKTPKQIDFQAELPRAATGKLYKRQIRDAYWKDTSAS